MITNGKRETTKGIELPKPEKHKNDWREGKLQVLGNTVSGSNKDKRKKWEKSSLEGWENFLIPNKAVEIL